MPKDFLDEVIRERTARNPAFPRLVEEAALRRDIARQLATKREAVGLSQTVVAARMGTSASVVSKLEGGGDIKLSTLQRYCAAIDQGLPQRMAKAMRSSVGVRRASAASRRRHS